MQWAEWAGRVHELGGVFVSGEGRVFNSTHVFHANGCHGLNQHGTADVAGSRDRSGATVLQLAPLLLQVAPFLRENPELPLLLGQAWIPRLLAPASLRATIIAPPAADELYFVRRLIQQFGESNVTVVQRLAWKQARTILPRTSLLVSLPLPSLLPLLIYSRPNSSLLLLQPPTGLAVSHTLSSSSSASSSSLPPLPSHPILSTPSPEPFLSSSFIVQSLSATCHLHVVSVPSERLNFKPLPKLWLVTEPEAREDGEMDLGDSQGGGSAVGAEGGGWGVDERRENGDEGNDNADWGEEEEEEGGLGNKSMQVEGKRDEVEERREKEEDVGGIRITWSREDLGEAVSEACLHLGLDYEGVGVSGIKADEIVRRGGSEEEWTVRESLKYEWRTPPGKCPLGGLKPFDGAAFCKRAREERGTFTIVFLGDSLTFQMAGSFLNGLLRHVAKPASWAVDESEPKQCVDWLLGRGGGGTGAGAGVGEDGSKKLRRAARWRNLRSQDGNASAATGADNMGVEEEGEEEEEEDEEEEDGGVAPVVVTPHPFCKVYVFHENVCPGVKIHVIRNDHLYIQDPDLTNSADGSSNGSATGGSVPFDHMPWHLYDGLVNADVVIVNRGAHYIGGRDFELSVRAAMRLLRRKLPRALLVYRNSPPGHVNCSSYDRPIKIRQDPATLPFHWDTFSAQNDIAREIAEEVKAVYMDVDTMTALRPDGHKGYVKERGITDCLHYCTPGPVDTWVEIFGNIIAHGVFNEGFEK
ncbi:unnamed protein product [Closterium sp. Yama58-4]|nr:unnamed protein product [Closterium sp. Yama58-4]